MDSDDITKLTGSAFAYDYYELPHECSDEEITSYCATTREMFAPIARSFDDQKNTEWLVRSYLALKFVLGSSVLGSSAQYAEEHNLQITLPYLR